MIPVPSGVRVWLAVGRTDMRKGMNGLALRVQQGGHGFASVREQIAASVRVAVDADDASTNTAAYPVDRDTEVGGDFRNAEPARYLCPTGSLRWQLEPVSQTDSLDRAAKHRGA